MEVAKFHKNRVPESGKLNKNGTLQTGWRSVPPAVHDLRTSAFLETAHPVHTCVLERASYLLS